MTAYTVAADGTTSPSTPSFPQATLNDSLVPDGSYDQTSATAQVFIDGAFQLQSLFIGPAIEVDLGAFLGGSISGTGSITGSNDTTKILPAFVNDGSLDVNGTIAVALTSNGSITVSAGERLDIEGDLNRFGAGASTVTVAAAGELDINSESAAMVNALNSQGTLKITAPSTTFLGATTLAGTVLVQGNATNGVGSGILVARTTTSGTGAYVAGLDLRNATFAAPISNLTLAQDAQISFGSGTTTVARFAVAGSASGVAALDLVNVDGTLRITGDGTTAANQVSISQAEFAGTAASTGTASDLIDFMVTAATGGARLQGQIVIDANTTLRNDGIMSIGGQGTTATTIGAAAAAANSSFINGKSGLLTLAAGASLSVSAVQNAGAITVSGNSSFLQSITNTGTIDVTAGTLTLAGAVQNAGTIAVENGATLSIGAAFTQGSVALRSGGLLQLSQPASFASTIQAPAVGARIDLAGLNATAATVSNGAIVVTTTTGTFNLAETGLINGLTLGLSADNAGGTVLTVAAATSTPAPVTQNHPSIFRFFDTVHGTQFLTASASESQMLQASRPDLTYEGVGLSAVDPTTDPTAAPVFRFFDTKFGTHFYTSSATERDTVLATRPDLTNEGIGFYEHTTAQACDTVVYRFFDSNAGTHFYTANAGERATIIATRPDLISEGVGFYAPTTT